MNQVVMEICALLALLQLQFQYSSIRQSGPFSPNKLCLLNLIMHIDINYDFPRTN